MTRLIFHIFAPKHNLCFEQTKKIILSENCHVYIPKTHSLLHRRITERHNAMDNDVRDC